MGFWGFRLNTWVDFSVGDRCWASFCLCWLSLLVSLLGLRSILMVNWSSFLTMFTGEPSFDTGFDIRCIS